MSNTTATPTKLRSGDWGARVEGAAAVGDTIQITARSGKSWIATVDRVVWTGSGATICSTRRAATATPRTVKGNGRTATVSGGRRSRRCTTDGNCSSFGLSCFDCDTDY